MKIYITESNRHICDPIIIQHYFAKVSKDAQTLDLYVESNAENIVVTHSEILDVTRAPMQDGFIKFSVKIPYNDSNHYQNYVVEFTAFKRKCQKIIKQCIITQTLDSDYFVLCSSELCGTNILI